MTSLTRFFFVSFALGIVLLQFAPGARAQTNAAAPVVTLSQARIEKTPAAKYLVLSIPTSQDRVMEKAMFAFAKIEKYLTERGQNPAGPAVICSISKSAFAPVLIGYPVGSQLAEEKNGPILKEIPAHSSLIATNFGSFNTTGHASLEKLAQSKGFAVRNDIPHCVSMPKDATKIPGDRFEVKIDLPITEPAKK
jgi:hypothetical protein